MQDIDFEFDDQLKEIAVKLIEDTVVGTKQTTLEKKAKPQKEEALNCPRCHSINTKFCYYNNYSLTQPRYFCKTCKRYWTVGGSLRNIPVGGTSKKNKRSSLSSSSSNSSPSTLTKNIKLPDLITDNCTQNPKIHDSQDLNLTYPNISDLIQQNNINNTSASLYSSTSISTTVNTTTTSNSHLSALQLLPGITSSSSGLHSFMPSVQVHADPSSFYRSCGFPIQDFKPTLNFSLDEIGGSGFANLHGVDHQETSGRLSFPFEDLRQVSSSTNVSDQNNNKEHEQEQQGYLTGYWSGMLGGGGSW